MQQVIGGIVDGGGVEAVGEAEPVLVESEDVELVVVEIGIELSAGADVAAAHHVSPDGLHDMGQPHVGEVVGHDELQVAVDGEGHDGVEVGQHLVVDGACLVAGEGVVVERGERVFVEFLQGHEQRGRVDDEQRALVAAVEQVGRAERLAQVGSGRDAALGQERLVERLVFSRRVGHGKCHRCFADADDQSVVHVWFLGFRVSTIRC